MLEKWRVMDTGLRAAAQNIALDRALLEARHADEIPSTLRFSRVTPSVLLASRHSPAHESDVDYCATSSIAVQRRISGGDAVYCDGSQLGWALYLHQNDVGTSDMQAVARRICHAAAAALGALGIDARYRAPHEIEVDGRRVGAAGGVFEGNALLYQGMVHLDLDLTTWLRVMRTPAQPLDGQGIVAACDRLTDLRTVLGTGAGPAEVKDRLVAAFESEFAAEFHDADLSLSEHARYQHALAEIDTPDWLNLVREPSSGVTVASAAHQHAGGALRTPVCFTTTRGGVSSRFGSRATSSCRMRSIADLEAALRDTAVERFERIVRAFFSAREIAARGLTPADFAAVLRPALQLPLVVRHS